MVSMSDWNIYMDPLVHWAKACANDYKAWYLSKHLDVEVRQWNMYRNRMYWECAGAIYRVQRRKQRNYA